MSKNSRVVAIIPARKGSKRLPGKNMLALNHKPLLVWTLEAAINSQVFDEIILSTDIPEALAWVETFQGDSQKIVRAVERPRHLANDTSTSIQVIQDLVESEKWSEQGIGEIWLLPPTTPFRNKDHIREAKGLLTKDWDSVISVTEFQIPVEWAFKLDGSHGLAAVFESSPLSSGKSQNQNYTSTYYPNGAIYGSSLKHLIETGSFYKGRMRGFKMSRENSIDIDTLHDFKFAEALLSHAITPN